MPKPIKQAKRPRDVIHWARQIVEETIREAEPPVAIPVEGVPSSAVPNAAQISAYMAKMGWKGGKIGGTRRLETMSAVERSQLAKKAATARWGKGKCRRASKNVEIWTEAGGARWW